jgi:hypothetical protein
MLDFLRHHQKSVLLVVTVVVCITFGWFYVRTDTGAGSAGGSTVLGSIYGEDITARDYQNMERHATVASQLQLPGMEILSSLLPPGSQIGYVAAMRMIREEAARLGLAVTPEEAENFITTLPAFQSNGKFDPAKFQLYAGEGSNDGLFIERPNYFGQSQMAGPYKLSRLGMSVGDLREVVADYMLLDKLRELLGAGLAYNPKEAERDYARNQQKVKASVVRIPHSRFLDTIQVSEEDIKKEYEDAKAANSPEIMTNKKWSIEYVAIAAEKLPPPAPLAPSPDGKEPEPEPESAEKARERAKLADTIYRALTPGKTLAEIATSNGQTAVTTDLFEIANPPEALAGRNQFISAISKLTADRPSPPPVKDGDTWYVFRLVKLEEPQIKELEVVREQLAKSIKDRKAREAALAAAKELHEKVKALLEGGKSFADAVAEVGEKAEESPSPDKPMDASPDERVIARAIGLAKPGTLGEPVETQDAVLVPYLVAREITKSESKGVQLAGQTSRMSEGLRYAVFNEWWFNRLSSAEFIDKTRGEQQPAS